MNRSRAVVGGASILVGSQVVVTLVQVGSGAMTARLLKPSAFGTFAAAMAITGLLGVVLTSATTTAVLRENELTPARVSKLWVFALLAGVLGAAVTWCAAPWWADLYHSSSAEPLIRWLSIQVGIAPMAVTGSALLRREHRAGADAATQAGSMILGLAVGVAAVWLWRDALLLVVSPIVAAISLYIATLFLRRERYPWQRPDREWSIGGANTQIVLQNLYFFGLSAIPLWLVSRVADEHELGLFSRASAIPGMVVGAITLGLIRSTQPHYRSVDKESRGAALFDTVVMTGAVGIPLMALLAACARPLITLWLGPAWAQGADYIPIIAAGSAAYLMFSMLVNAAETLNYLADVRFAQLAMVPALVVIALVSVALGSPEWAAGTMLAVALPGIVVLARALVRQGFDQLAALPPAMTIQFVCGTVIAVIGWLCADTLQAAGSLVALLVAAVLVAVLFAVTLPLRPEWQVLRNRGLLPGRWALTALTQDGPS